LGSNKDLADFVFTVDGEEFKVHKAILAGELTALLPTCNSNLFNSFLLTVRSSVFEKMFLADLQEARESKGTIEETTKEVFTDFLAFIYTGDAKNLADHVVELLAIAHQYEVGDLKKVCEGHLRLGLNDANALDIFLYTHLYDCDLSLKKASFFQIKA
jgi:BTB/POZ domain